MALYQWIKDRRFLPEDEPDDYTHTDISGGSSRIRVVGDESVWAEFFWLYCKDVCSVNGYHYLSEVADPTAFRAYIDMDLAFGAERANQDMMVLLKPILKIIFSVVHDMFFGEQGPPDMLEMWVITRRAKLTPNVSVKYGEHIHWPNLTVNLAGMIKIRTLVVLRLVRSDIRLPGVVGGTGDAGDRPPWGQIIDDLYNPRPKLRLSLSDKTAMVNRNRMHVDQQSYDKIRCVLNVKLVQPHPPPEHPVLELQEGVIPKYEPIIPEDHPDFGGPYRYDMDRAMLFVRKLSIRVIGGDNVQVHVPCEPRDYREEPSSSRKRGRGRPPLQLSEAESADVTKRELEVADWVSCMFKVKVGRCKLVSARPSHFTVELYSRFCANKGSDHTSNRSYVHVSSYPPPSSSINIQPKCYWVLGIVRGDVACFGSGCVSCMLPMATMCRESVHGPLASQLRLLREVPPR